MKKASFLLIDSKPLALNELETMMESLGYRDLESVKTATKAWNRLQQRPFDGIISTWDMSDMTGLALLKLVRKEDRLFDLPFFLTDSAFTKLKVVQAGQAGVSALLVEPYSLETLDSKIEAMPALMAEITFAKEERTLEAGINLIEGGQYEEALAVFESLTEEAETAESYYNIGYVKTVQEKFEEAIPAFQKAVQLDRLYAKAFKAMGQAYRALGMNEEAEASLQKAADIYMSKDNDQEAEDILNEIKEISPDTINVYNSLGVLYRRKGDFKSALKQYEKALKVHAEEPFIYYNIGRLHVDLKEMEKAKVAFENAVRIKPEFKEAQEVLAAIEMGLL